MIEGISSVYSRIRDIYDRVNELQRNVNSIYSLGSVNSIQRMYNSSSSASTKEGKNQKTFEEVLREVMFENTNLGEGKGEKVNVLVKPEESIRELLLDSQKLKEGNLRKSDVKDSLDAKYDDIIKEASRKYNLPPELIKAVIKAESNFNPIAISPKNAMGLMQLIPSTAKELGVEDPFDPYQNIMGGSKYLRMMIDRYNGNLFLALSAYNAGPSIVDKTSGIPDIEETKNYVDAVIRFYKEYSR